MERNPNPVLSDEEFEPFCKWERGKDMDVLKIHVQEFIKEQLRVQISNRGNLKISGERPLDALRKSRFFKEVRLSGNSDATAIHAKFVNGWLHIIMPKRAVVHEQQDRKGSEETPKIDQIQPGKMEPLPEPKDRSSDEVLPRGSGGGEEQLANSAGNSSVVDEFQDEERDNPRFGVATAAALSLVATASLAILVAYAVYVFKSTVSEVDDFIM